MGITYHIGSHIYVKPHKGLWQRCLNYCLMTGCVVIICKHRNIVRQTEAVLMGITDTSPPQKLQRAGETPFSWWGKQMRNDTIWSEVRYVEETLISEGMERLKKLRKRMISHSFISRCCWMGWCHHSRSCLSLPLMWWNRKVREQQQNSLSVDVRNCF